MNEKAEPQSKFWAAAHFLLDKLEQMLYFDIEQKFYRAFVRFRSPYYGTEYEVYLPHQAERGY